MLSFTKCPKVSLARGQIRRYAAATMAVSSLQTPVVYLPGDKTPAPPLLTPSDVCRMLYLRRHRGETHAQRLEPWRRKGLLESVRIGKRVFFRLVDVLSFIDAQKDAQQE